MRLHGFSWVFVWGVLAAPVVQAQTPRVTLQGVVRDSVGRPVAGANVFVLETLDGTLADSAGRFSLTLAAPFPFTLHAKLLGYEPWQRVMASASDVGAIAITLNRAAATLPPITVQAGAYTAGEERGATLTPLEVVTTPGTAADINRAIQLLPGVQAVDDGTALFVRGGDFSETKAFINDAPLLNPAQLLAPSGTFVGTVDPFQLDGIFFSSGGFGARYGDALSAVVGLRTRGATTRHEGTLGAGLAAVSGDVAIRASQTLTLRAAGNRVDLRPYFKVNDPSRRFTPPPRGRDLSAAAIWAYRPGAELKLFTIDQTNVVGLALEEPSFSGTYDSNLASRLTVLTWRDVIGAVAPTIALSEGQLSRNERYGSFLLDASQRERQLFAQLAWEPRPLATVRLGAEAVRITSHLSGSVPARRYDNAPTARSIAFAYREPAQRYGAFVELDWRPIEVIRLVPGVRVDRSSLTQQVTVDPRLNAAWRLGTLVTLTGAVGVYHQVPDPLLFADSIGVAGLPPMRGTQTVVGLNLGGDDGAPVLRVEAYDKRYDDLAQQTRDFHAVAGGVGHVRGVDVFFRGRLPLGGIDMRATTSFLNARRTDPNTGLVVDAPFDITHTSSVILERPIGQGTRLGLTYRAASGKPFTPVVRATFDAGRNLYTPTYGDPMSERYPAFRRLDASVSQLVPVSAGLVAVLYASVSNIANRANVQGWRYSQDYQTRTPVPSIFNRSVYFGASLLWQ